MSGIDKLSPADVERIIVQVNRLAEAGHTADAICRRLNLIPMDDLKPVDGPMRQVWGSMTKDELMRLLQQQNERIERMTTVMQRARGALNEVLTT